MEAAKTLDETFAGFTALVNGYKGRYGEKEVADSGRMGAILRDAYKEKIGSDRIDCFFREVPNFSDICAGLNHRLATSPNSDINVGKLVEAGDIAKAEAFLGTYLESATRDNTEADTAARKALGIFGELAKYRSKDAYRQWRKELKEAGSNYEKIGVAVSKIAGYLGSVAAISGSKPEIVRGIGYLVGGNALSEVMVLEGSKASLDARLGELVAAGDGGAAVREVIGYFQSAVAAYGPKAGFKETDAEVNALEQKRLGLVQKAKESAVPREEIADLIESIFAVKKKVDDYGSVKDYVNSIIKMADSMRGVQVAKSYAMNVKGKERKVWRDDFGRFVKAPAEYRNGLAKFESAVTEHLNRKCIEKRMERAVDVMKKTWFYMQGKDNPAEIDPSIINFEYLGSAPSGSVLPYQRKVAYNIASADREKLARLEELAKSIHRAAKPRIEKGEDAKAAVLSELDDATISEGYPLEELAEEFPYAGLVGVENIANGRTDVAEILGIEVPKPEAPEHRYFPTFAKWGKGIAKAFSSVIAAFSPRPAKLQHSAQ